MRVQPSNETKCPLCGGSVIVEEGWIICVEPGFCVYSEEIK